MLILPEGLFSAITDSHDVIHVRLNVACNIIRTILICYFSANPARKQSCSSFGLHLFTAMSCTEYRFSLSQFSIDTYQDYLFPPAEDADFEEVSCFDSTVCDFESFAATSQSSTYESLDVTNTSNSPFEAYPERDFDRYYNTVCYTYAYTTTTFFIIHSVQCHVRVIQLTDVYDF